MFSGYRHVVLMLLLVGLMACSHGEVRFLDDRAGLLSEEQRERLHVYSARLLDDLDIHLQVTVLDAATADIDRLSVKLFEVLHLGEATGAARGVLLLVDPSGQQVRLEIGYDLESVFTDLLVSRIERQQMVPFFEAGRIADGLEATVELLVAAAMGVPFEAGAGGDTLEHLSGGGGAKTAVVIGAGRGAKGVVPNPDDFLPGDTPLATLTTYAAVLNAQVKDPDLAIYTPASRDFFREWLVTDGQQASEYKSVCAALKDGEEILRGDRAVVRCPAGKRPHAPYLLVLSPEGWQLDFVTMSRVIGFNHCNQWFFRTLEHPYMFAFADGTFDRHGFLE